jgi:hypothetical protein
MSPPAATPFRVSAAREGWQHVDGCFRRQRRVIRGSLTVHEECRDGDDLGERRPAGEFAAEDA